MDTVPAHTSHPLINSSPQAVEDTAIIIPPGWLSDVPRKQLGISCGDIFKAEAAGEGAGSQTGLDHVPERNASHVLSSVLWERDSDTAATEGAAVTGQHSQYKTQGDFTPFFWVEKLRLIWRKIRYIICKKLILGEITVTQKYSKHAHEYYI